MADRKWTLEQRKRQSQLIRQWKPWEKSTGPRTPEGKENSKMNAVKGSIELHQALKDAEEALQAIKEAEELFRDIEG